MRYEIWYQKPDAPINGLRMFDDYELDGKELTETHVPLKIIEAEDLNEVFVIMQGEVWSPNGEARDLIVSKGLHHTSMSVGDVAVAMTPRGPKFYQVSAIGFTEFIPIF